MKKSFFVIPAILLLSIGILPVAQARDIECVGACEQLARAKARGPIPTAKPLTCIHFTKLPMEGPVMIQAWKGDRLALKSEKIVSAADVGEFCFATAKWNANGTTPDKVKLCHRPTDIGARAGFAPFVILHGDEVAKAVSLPGKLPEAYACVRGIGQCGGTDHVLLRRDQF
jgi:hypothetical protein